MSFVVETRASDSDCIDTVMQGLTASEGVAIRPAEIHWHLVLRRYEGETRMIVVYRVRSFE